MFNIRPKSPLFVGTSPARQETICYVQPLPPSTAILPASDPSKRRTRKTVYDAHSDLKQRVSQLSPEEQRLVRHYAGDTDETRARVLEKIEFYRRQNNDQPPIISRDSQRQATGPNGVEWSCMICSASFSTFQRVAIHLTSKEWSLASWVCPLESCSRAYQALDQLRRHIKTNHQHASSSSESAAPSTLSSQLHVDGVLEHQPLPFIRPTDGDTRSVTPLGSNYAGSAFGLAKHFERPPCNSIPEMQPQASSVFDPPPPSLPLPVLNQFVGNAIPNSYQASWRDSGGSENTLASQVTNTARQFQLTEHVESFPRIQYNPQGSTEEAGFATPGCYSSALCQLGSCSSSTSNSLGRPMRFQVPQTHPRSCSTSGTKIHPQLEMFWALPSSGRLCCVGSSEEPSMEAFWSSVPGFLV